LKNQRMRRKRRKTIVQTGGKVYFCKRGGGKGRGERKGLRPQVGKELKVT